MKARNLIVLLILAMGLGIGAYMNTARKGRFSDAAVMMGKPVLGVLQAPDTLAAIEKLAFVTSAGTVTVARVDNAWVAPGKFNYPVNFSKLRDFVQKLADMKIGHVVPSGRRQREELNLVAPGDAEPGKARQTGTLVQLMDKADSVLAEVVVGKERMKRPDPDSPYGGFGGYPDGRFVAVGDEAYLISETLSGLPKTDKDWLDDNLLNIRSSEIMEMEVTDAEGNTLRFVRPGEHAALTLDDLAENEEMETSRVNNLANMLSYLTFSDVVDPALPDENLGMEAPTSFAASTKKGKVFTLKVGGSPEGSSDRYLRLFAVHEPPDVVEAPLEDEADPDAAARKAEEANRQKEEQTETAREVREFNEKVEGWTYLIRSYKMENLSTDRSRFVKEKEKIAADEVEEDAADSAKEEEGESAGTGEESPEGDADPAKVPTEQQPGDETAADAENQVEAETEDADDPNR